MNANVVQWALEQGYSSDDINTPEKVEKLREEYDAAHRSEGKKKSQPPRRAEMALSLFEGSQHLETFRAEGERPRGKNASEKGVIGQLNTQAAMWAAEHGYNFASLKKAVAEIHPFVDE